MSIRLYEFCEICKKRIYENEKTLVMRAGQARASGFFRNLFGLINLRKPASYATIHINCLEYTEYEHEKPVETIENIVDSIKIGEEQTK